MNVDRLYDRLIDFSLRPQPFSRYTAPAFWSDPHVSRQMLKWHLAEHTDRASYRPDKIRQLVAWLQDEVGFDGRAVCDLGCGPGLYAERLHDLGADVIGLDVSENSLSHARQAATSSGRSIDYRLQDYTSTSLPHGMDGFMIISEDIAVLSPAQRQDLLVRIHQALNPGGWLVFDAPALAALESFEEASEIEADLMNGFWAPTPYLGLKKSYKYPVEMVSLERYLVVQAERTFEVFNWLQYFDPATLEIELTRAGFVLRQVLGSLNGQPFDPRSHSIGVVVTRR